MSVEQVTALRAMLAERPAGLPIEARRAGFEAMAAAMPLPADYRDEVTTVGGVPARWVWTDGAAAEGALLWLHGGAFMVGSSASYRAFAARLSRACGARVLLPDYRLVPEHRFPAALDDTLAVLDALDMDVAIGGDSAGGNLAAAAAQARPGRCRAAWLLSPYLDLTHAHVSRDRAARDPFVPIDEMPATAAAYADDASDPRVSPAFGPVERFPPALIQVGSDEVLFGDALAFADRLRAGGHAPVFQEWVGMIHAWPFFADRIDEGGHAIAQGGAFLRAHLHG